MRLSEGIFILQGRTETLFLGPRQAFGYTDRLEMDSEEVIRRFLREHLMDPHNLVSLRRLVASWAMDESQYAYAGAEAVAERFVAATRSIMLSAYVVPDASGLHLLDVSGASPHSLTGIVLRLLDATLGHLHPSARAELAPALARARSTVATRIAAWARAGQEAPLQILDALVLRRAVQGVPGGPLPFVAQFRDALDAAVAARTDRDMDIAAAACARAIQAISVPTFLSMINGGSPHRLGSYKGSGGGGLRRPPPERRERAAPLLERPGWGRKKDAAPTKAGPPPAKPAIIHPATAKRAQAKYDKLSPSEQKKMDAALADAKSDEERAYIWKAFAACHTPAECAAFGKQIRGKDAKWMQDNLQMTGSSTGTGVQQQFSHSCNATTVQAVRGTMDPVYALKVHKENPNFGKVDDAKPMKENPKLAKEQRDMLTSEYSGPTAGKHSGVAAGRGEAGGSGRWADDLLNAQKGSTGVEYATAKNPADPTTKIDDGLKTGAPVPIVIGNGPSQFTHYVLVTGADAEPPKNYTIHDPWSGKTVSRSVDDVKNGKINLAGSNQVTAVEVPTSVPPDPTGKPPC